MTRRDAMVALLILGPSLAALQRRARAGPISGLDTSLPDLTTIGYLLPPETEIIELEWRDRKITMRVEEIMDALKPWPGVK